MDPSFGRSPTKRPTIGPTPAESGNTSTVRLGDESQDWTPLYRVFREPPPRPPQCWDGNHWDMPDQMDGAWVWEPAAHMAQDSPGPAPPTPGEGLPQLARRQARREAGGGELFPEKLACRLRETLAGWEACGCGLDLTRGCGSVTDAQCQAAPNR